jgi:hypothetical protein
LLVFLPCYSNCISNSNLNLVLKSSKLQRVLEKKIGFVKTEKRKENKRGRNLN